MKRDDVIKATSTDNLVLKDTHSFFPAGHLTGQWHTIIFTGNARRCQ